MTRFGYCFLLFVLIFTAQGQLFIAPSSTILQFVSSSLTFHCYHSRHDVNHWNWFINNMSVEQSPLKSFVSIMDDLSYVSSLTIHNLTPEFNNSVINCSALLSTGIMESSQGTYILLQGLLSNVKNLALTTNGSSLLLSWTAPFSILGDISYVVMERRPTLMTEMTYLTESLNQNIGVTSSFLSECSDYIFYVIPENKVGFGQETFISVVHEELIIFNYSLWQNSLQKYDIVLDLSSVVCSTSVKITSNILNSNSLAQVTLKNITDNEYQYILNLNLPAGENYQLDILLMNNNYSCNQTIKASTHSVHDIQFQIIQPGLLTVMPVYLNNSSNGMTFLCLLLCTIDNCSEIQYEKSIFRLIKLEIYNLTYASGYYQIFAFDVDTDGAVYTSDKNTAYPAINKRMNLTYDTHILSVPQVVKECFLQHDSNIVSTTCNPELNRAEQQILLLPIDVNNLENNGIRVSELSELSNTLCFSTSSSDYLALTVIVEDDSASSHPFGILSPSQTGFIQEDICTPRTTMLHMEKTPNSAHSNILVIVISTFCVAVIIAVLIPIIILLVLWRKRAIANAETYCHDEVIAKLASGVEKKLNSSLTPNQLSEIQKLCSGRESKWYEIGVNAGMSKEMLETIQKKHTNDRERCIEIMQEMVLENDAALTCFAEEEESHDHNNTAL